MKRILAFLIIMVLLCSFAGSAFADEFIFRNGIHWRDSMDAVKAAEDGDPFEGTIDSGFEYLVYGNKKVSKYEADLQYAFYNEEFVLATYICYGITENDAEYIINALIQKYGEPIGTDFERCIRLMDMIDEGSADYMEVLSNWELEDGTYIAVVKSVDGDVTDIIYFCEEAMLEMSENNYNTDGL